MQPDSASRSEWAHGFAAIGRAWPLIALLAVMVGAVAAFASAMAPELERATGRLIVAPAPSDEAAFAPDAVRVLTQPGVIGTLTEVLENPGTLESAADDAGLAREALSDYAVTALELTGSLVVELTVEGPDGDTADALAAGVIEDGTQLFDQLYPVYQVQILDPVRIYAGGTTLSPVQYAVVGALVGALGGCLLVLAFSRLRRPPTSGPHLPPPGAVRPDGEVTDPRSSVGSGPRR